MQAELFVNYFITPFFWGFSFVLGGSVVVYMAWHIDGRIRERNTGI